jgi:5-methylcytosine-specific restriction protein A
MGMEGDQSLEAVQNKTLAESNSNGVDVHLFEVHSPREYTYVGRVRLAEEPYSEKQSDKNGRERLVWIFPLKPESGTIPQLSEQRFYENAEKKEREARRLSDRELQIRATSGREEPGTRTVIAQRFERNPWVSEFARRRANGVCQLCHRPAPFKDRDGAPFLEIHHIVWLSRGGDDTIENTVALCPNCHRKMHLLDLERDKKKLLQELVSAC